MHSSHVAFSTGRSAPLKWLGVSLVLKTLIHWACVVGVTAIQKPRVSTTGRWPSPSPMRYGRPNCFSYHAVGGTQASFIPREFSRIEPGLRGSFSFSPLSSRFRSSRREQRVANSSTIDRIQRWSRSALTIASSRGSSTPTRWSWAISLAGRRCSSRA